MLDFLKETILEAGDICVKASTHLDSVNVDYKSDKDLVTEIDTNVENFLIHRILDQYPDHSVWGEETGKQSTASEYCWIIDPIDGTTSFYHGQPYFSISIALQKNNETIMGGVYAPVLNHLFLAQKKQGAFLNHVPIKVSSTDRLVNAVFATGFACLRAGLPHNNLIYFNRIMPQIRDIRRYGSAALDLCYVACGKLDGFWEINLNAYDVAAGVLIVQEAGGIVCDLNGFDQYPQHGILAANPELKDRLLSNFNGFK